MAYLEIILMLFINIPMATAAGLLPGTFFWRPRLGAFSYNKPGSAAAGEGGILPTVHAPIRANIRLETVVLIDGYSLGLTVLAIVTGYHASKKPFPHLHPKTASYYTNAYRWGLRHLSLLAPWMGGMGGKYIDTHKVWRRRFHYMEEFVPQWLRRFTPWIEQKEWDEEEQLFATFMFYADPAFGKHYRYPTKQFNNYRSQWTEETLEHLEK